MHNKPVANNFQENKWKQQLEEVSLALSRREGELARLLDAAAEMKAEHKAKEAADEAVLSKSIYDRVNFFEARSL